MEFDLSTLQPKERASFALRALYEAAGCRKYHMGRFEEYSLYRANRSFLSSEQVITFTDLDGRLLALKPDVTLSIAKTAQPAPGETLRYYYHENVYRPSAESHTFKEIGQMGLEFLGGVGEAEVQQAVCLAAQSLGQLGTDWVLEVSHMGYLFGLLDALQVPEDARAGLLRKLGQKNAHELRAAALAAGLDEDAADTLCRVLTLCGGYADTLPRAEALCRNDAMRAAVAELEALAVPLEKAGGVIRLDMTLAGEMEYYNGLVFQGYLKALPRPLLKGGRYDLLMLDVTLPDGTGFDFCREVRRTSGVPILFLTASDEEMDIITGLDLGGDDYITKPFKLGVLLSRVHALLRRAGGFGAQQATELCSGGIRVDLLAGRAEKNGVPLELTAAEYKLLCLFLRSPGQVLTKETILNALWDCEGNYVDTNTLTVYIRRLRLKVEDDPGSPQRLVTVRGMGYRWNGDV